MGKSSGEWLATFTQAGVPCGPVNSIPEALAEPHTSAREMILQYAHPTFGTVKSIASPVRVGAQTPAVRRAPQRNEDATTILRDLLGYDDATIAKLTESGAFGELLLVPV